MNPYERLKDGFRFKWGGLNTRSQPDALAPDKYQVAVNVRATSDNSVRTRPGYVKLFGTVNRRITDIKAYSAINTDALPRFLCRNQFDDIYLDTGVRVGTLATSSADGAVLIPFRPAQSPDPWMYIANDKDYQKFSAPDSGNNVTQQKVGIAEPQLPAEMCPDRFWRTDFTPVAADCVVDGVVITAVADAARAADVCGVVFQDPASGPNPRYSAQVTNTPQYQLGEELIFTIGGLPSPAVVEDILPPLNVAGLVVIKSIFYFAGANGRCIIVPSIVPTGSNTPNFTEGLPVANSVFASQVAASLRRGSLIQLQGGPEICFVRSVTIGPDGNVCIETSTTGTHIAAESITGLPAVSVAGITGGAAGNAIAANQLNLTVAGAGTGTVDNYTELIPNNPFNQLIGTTLPQQDDYLHFSVKVTDWTKVSVLRFSINVCGNVGDVTFTNQAYYYEVNINSVLGLQPNKTTALPSSEWYEVMIPLTSLTRIGTDYTQTLNNAYGQRLTVVATGACTVSLSSIWVGGGGSPDVGSDSPFFYAIRPRSSVTGVKGNPSPITRYGVSPRRQRVIITLPTVYADPQVDTWDVFRYGGSITTLRYIGSVKLGAATFTDNYPIESAVAGDAIDYTNFEPWPSVDLPFTVNPGIDASGIQWTVQVCGTTILIMASAGIAFDNPFPSNITKWLPGTLLTLGGQSAYTLFSRPTAFVPAAHPALYYCYMLQLVENAGFNGLITTLSSGPQVQINEPSLANQPNPYVWGPDAYGTVFGAGDLLRPGTFSFTKPYAPDSVPVTNNRELTDPSEPLMGGEVIDGISFVGSATRWWGLYFQAGNNISPYQPVEAPVGRGIAAPFGVCTDGRAIYFWANDCIAMHAGGAYKSLTDADLFNLFPHDGVRGEDVTRGAYTFRAPDYGRANTFRLTYCNGYLYATYETSDTQEHTLVLDIKKMAWSVDAYAAQVSVPYAVEHQEGPIADIGQVYPVLLFGDKNGNVYQQKDLVNDDGTPISSAIGTFEFDGGDIRSSDQWGDIYLNCLPASPITATPITESAGVNAATVVPTNAARTQAYISLSGGELLNYLGLLCQWTDDFATQAKATTLYVWQPSYLNKPENSTNRYSDWDDGGAPGAKFWQGFILEADTYDQDKLIEIRDADSLALHTIQPSPVNHNGQQEKAYSFTTPFVAHLVRIEPQDLVEWRQFGVKWVWQPTPEQVRTWQTQRTAHGMQGYHHIRQLLVAYSSNADVSVIITSQGGQSPTAITLPSTGGQYQKLLVTPTFNKGLLFNYAASSAQPFQFWLNDFEIMVGQWGRAEAYVNVPILGGVRGDRAEI